MSSSPTRGSSFFLRKSDCLGCAVWLCLVVCLTLLASFFLPSASLINMHSSVYCTMSCIYMYMYTCIGEMSIVCLTFNGLCFDGMLQFRRSQGHPPIITITSCCRLVVSGGEGRRACGGMGRLTPQSSPTNRRQDFLVRI